jgi:hypothetical protein
MDNETLPEPLDEPINSRYFIGDYSVKGHEDSLAVERKEGRG